jgi:hypothetical protein
MQAAELIKGIEDRSRSVWREEKRLQCANVRRDLLVVLPWKDSRYYVLFEVSNKVTLR